MAEFASAIAARVRSGDTPRRLAQVAYSQFDAWTASKAKRIEINPADVSVATSFIRRLDLPLKTGDAIHIAVAQRLGATLATFDRQMEASAGLLGVSVVAR
jgi:predicted nucleic acid-binding protein